jgi:hypothetical protein
VYFEHVDPTISVLRLTIIMLDSILDPVGYVLVGCYRHVEQLTASHTQY